MVLHPPKGQYFVIRNQNLLLDVGQDDQLAHSRIRIVSTACVCAVLCV